MVIEMKWYNIVFKPLDCREDNVSDIVWYHCVLSLDQEEYIVGATKYEGSLIYFLPMSNPEAVNTWEEAKKNYVEKKDYLDRYDDWGMAINRKAKLVPLKEVIEELLV
ncbi:MAG: hypothetical protein J6Y29_01530 [Clostridiales bacterium]|nr:hypothetical protein [Clostridiales bacterium]